MIRLLLTILKKRKYFWSALSAFLVLTAVSYYLTVVNVYQNSLIIYAELNGGLFTIISLSFSLLTTFFFGLYLALLLFKIDISKNRLVVNQATGWGATAINLVASGCPSCGTPILGLIGFPMALFSLPWHGIELKILSLILLLISIFFLLKNIKNSLFCQLKPKTV